MLFVEYKGASEEDLIEDTWPFHRKVANSRMDVTTEEADVLFGNNPLIKDKALLLALARKIGRPLSGAHKHILGLVPLYLLSPYSRCVDAWWAVHMHSPIKELTTGLIIWNLVTSGGVDRDSVS